MVSSDDGQYDIHDNIMMQCMHAARVAVKCCDDNIYIDNSNIFFFVPAAQPSALTEILHSNHMRDKVRER